jgi:hypothetical protein
MLMVVSPALTISGRRCLAVTGRRPLVTRRRRLLIAGHRKLTNSGYLNLRLGASCLWEQTGEKDGNKRAEDDLQTGFSELVKDNEPAFLSLGQDCSRNRNPVLLQADWCFVTHCAVSV